MEVSPRDIVYSLDIAAGQQEPSVLATTDLRYSGISWGDGDLALVYESWHKTRRTKTWMIKPDQPGRQETKRREVCGQHALPGWGVE